MAYIRLKGSLVPPTNPAITFMPVSGVISLAHLLVETTRKRGPIERLHAFIYSCLIYDNYANAYNLHNQSDLSQLESWRALASHTHVSAYYQRLLGMSTGSGILGDIHVQLPVKSNNPRYEGKRAPRSHQGPEARVCVRTLSAEDYIEVIYMMRCNLLHGYSDISDDKTAILIVNAGLPFVRLVEWMVKNTTR